MGMSRKEEQKINRQIYKIMSSSNNTIAHTREG